MSAKRANISGFVFVIPRARRNSIAEEPFAVIKMHDDEHRV